MLERYFPNLYGWLVWGGGMETIARCAVGAGIVFVLLVVFLLGGYFL